MDCPDLDSVHNDYQRHLPYLWYVGRFEVEKWTQYAILNPLGYVNENPGFAQGDVGNNNGRIMGDTTTIWLLELLEIYRHTGDRSLIDSYWPQITRAANWQIQNASAIGLPTHLVCTYDILSMEVYNTTTFNAFLHLAAMKAVVELSAVAGDTEMGASAAAAFTRGQSATIALLWNGTLGYFRAYTGGDAIMTDALYGQVVATTHGLGWLADTSYLIKLLNAELRYNSNAFGLTVVTGRHEPPPIAKNVRPSLRYMAGLTADLQDDAVWLGAAPDWSYLMLLLGTVDVPTALEPTRKQSENWRSRLNDLWNIAGLSTTDSADWRGSAQGGQPLCTSHYGFALVNYYLVYALSNQVTDVARGKLTFAPLYPCPFRLPVMLMDVEGSVSCVGSGGRNVYTLDVAFGALTLPAGGLAVNGVAYTKAVALTGGQSVTWSD